MTNKRIVEDLKAIADFFISESQGAVPVALEEAIKIIEQQPCEDCISREQAINELKLAYFNKDLQSAKDDPCIVDAMTDWAIRTIKKLPSVTPKTRWIPCSEKMPDINIHVLAQFVMGGMAECYYAHNWWHIVGGVRISGDEVIAWMPLPEPYKAEREDKE